MGKPRTRRLVIAFCCLLFAGFGFEPQADAVLKKVSIGHRTVWLLVPAASPPKDGYPLVVALHWAGARGRSYVAAWESFYKKKKLIVAFPTAAGTRWHLGDRKHVLRTVKELRSRYNVNPRRIYLAGFSRGGSYAYTFGMMQDSPFVSLAPMAAGLVSIPALPPRRFDVCIFHGDRDRLVKPERSAMMVPMLREKGHRVQIWFVNRMRHKHEPRITPRVFRCLDRKYQRYKRLLNKFT